MQYLTRDKLWDVLDFKHYLPHHEGATSLVLVSEVSTADGEETSDDVRRNGKELSTFVGETHVLDNGRKELRGAPG